MDGNIKVRIWLDDDARTGLPWWAGTIAGLGGTIPQPGDTLTFPRAGDPAGVLVVVIDEPRNFTFGDPARSADGRFWLEAVDLGARAET